MMRKLLIMMSVLLFAFGISGCVHSYNQKKYQQYTASIHPIFVPKGLKLKKSEQYYQVPKIATMAPAGPVSLVPPGSKVLQYRQKKKQRHVHGDQSLNSHWSRNKDGSLYLALPVKLELAWNMVADALQKSPYKILDKDNTIKSFYVLDTSITNNTITQKTPIYRIFIKNDGSEKSQVGIVGRHHHSMNPKVAKRILGNLKKNIA